MISALKLLFFYHRAKISMSFGVDEVKILNFLFNKKFNQLSYSKPMQCLAFGQLEIMLY